MNNPTPPSASTPTGNMFWPALFAGAALATVAPVLYVGIHKFTHHRPLGAATLAVASLAAFVGLFAVAWRLRVGRTLALGALALVTLGLVVFGLVT